MPPGGWWRVCFGVIGLPSLEPHKSWRGHNSWPYSGFGTKPTRPSVEPSGDVYLRIRTAYRKLNETESIHKREVWIKKVRNLNLNQRAKILLREGGWKIGRRKKHHYLPQDAEVMNSDERCQDGILSRSSISRGVWGIVSHDVAATRYNPLFLIPRRLVHRVVSVSPSSDGTTVNH